MFRGLFELHPLIDVATVCCMGGFVQALKFLVMSNVGFLPCLATKNWRAVRSLMEEQIDFFFFLFHPL
jgi:hypothetical protein